jgi:hypothetical protein
MQRQVDREEEEDEAVGDGEACGGSATRAVRTRQRGEVRDVAEGWARSTRILCAVGRCHAAGVGTVEQTFKRFYVGWEGRWPFCLCRSDLVNDLASSPYRSSSLGVLNGRDSIWFHTDEMTIILAYFSCLARWMRMATS